MNIVVLTSSGKIVVRPDTTWERDNEDFYVPEFVDEISYTPVFFARVMKPGRSIGLRFANRYYDRLGYGVLLYPENFIDGSPEAYASAICLDHSSFLPSDMIDKEGFDSPKFELYKGEEKIYEAEGLSLEQIEKAIAELSRICYIRTGDLIAIELDSRKTLLHRNIAQSCTIGIERSDSYYSDFKIIL